MERRKFIQTSCNACIALSSSILIGTLASCSPKLSIAKVTRQGMKLLLPESDMASSDVKLITVKDFDYDVFLKKNTDGTYLALAMICTHAGHSLVKTGNTFYCSLHGSEFDMQGNVLKGPAEKNLVHLPVTNSRGVLEIMLMNSADI